MSDSTPENEAEPVADEAAEAVDAVEETVGDAADVASSAVAADEELPAALDDGQAFEHLPSHTRSLLKIEVPVSVRLAQQRIVLAEIVDLVPGSIIPFNKLCDEPSELLVGQQSVAQGVVVKSGDKFGLKIEKMIRPQEHFVPLE